MIREITENMNEAKSTKIAKVLANDFLEGLWDQDESFSPSMEYAITDSEIKAYARATKTDISDGETSEIIEDLKDEVLDLLDKFFKGGIK